MKTISRSFSACAIVLAALFSCASPIGNGSGGQTCAIIFDANGGVGTMATQRIASGSSANLEANGFTKTGYALGGWMTALDGTGESYAPGASFAMGTSDLTLYAVWIPTSLNFSSYPSPITITMNSNPTGAVQIPVGVTALGGLAFISANGITTLDIPASVKSIDSTSLPGGTTFSKITVDPDNPNYCSTTDGLLYDKARTSLIKVPRSYSGSLVLPSTVTTVGDFAASNCSSLTGISLPSGVTSLGLDAFTGCSGMSTITLPVSLRSIGGDCFTSSGISSVDIPSGVSSIGNEAFNLCSSLSVITVDSGNTSYKAQDNALFDYAMTTLIQVPIGIAASGFPIPSTVTTIGSDAFYGNNLTSISIPASVTHIGNYAFECCFSLASVTMASATPPTLGASVFDDGPNGQQIYVPANAIADYQSAIGWSSYGTEIVSP